MAAASYSQQQSSGMFTSAERYRGRQCSRKSFEAEDGSVIFRKLPSVHRKEQRYSLNINPAKIQYLSADLQDLRGSSVSLIGGDFLSGDDGFPIPRCSSDSNFLPAHKHIPVDVKRNHSLKTFLQKKIPPGIRRTRSSKQTQEKENRPLDMTSLMAQSSNQRNAEVELPFFMPDIENPDVLDLSTCASQFQGAIVRPIHQSILGRDHCFEVVVNERSRCFGCESTGERESWIEKIKRAINPNLDNSRRVEHQLILFVQEAKGLPTKKKYFCEICLDRKLCARTTSKWKNDSSIFWGEHFEFSSMPDIDDVTVHLYKDSDKKKKKDKDYLGLVNLTVRSLINQSFVEKWHTLSTPSGNNKNKAGEAMAIRIKARFLSTRVLPTEQYKPFAEYISRNYLKVCRTLGNVITVTRKDEIARILVSIMHATGSMKEYMTEVVMEEVDKVEEESLIFRENTIGTKSVEAMLRLVGMKYLHDILGDFIHALCNMEEECEVDGSRLPPHASLVVNQNNLQMSCEIALHKIVTSVDIFPSELREVMASWRVRCEAAGRPRIANRLVTASLFLRLLCPSILNPSLFGLANEVPDAKISRILTLIAKVIQNLANRSRFGNKEEYMQFMDKFVREKWDDMGSFITNVSDPTLPSLSNGFQGFIDLGKEFAKLHDFFTELLPTLDQSTVNALEELPDILAKITSALNKPASSPASYHRTPPLCRVSQDHLDLTQITEDVVLPNDSDHNIHPASSNSPMSVRRNFPASGESSSLLNLRQFINAVEEGHYDVASTSAAGVFPSQSDSHSSHAIACSFNNSNNASSNSNVRQLLSSTENVMTSTASIEQESRGPNWPLMFSNPTYQMPKHESLSAMHDSLNLQTHTHNTVGNVNKSSSVASTPTSHPSSLQEGKLPLSFVNPLQAMSSQQQHLETVFSTETVTYSAPTRYGLSSSPARSLAELREQQTRSQRDKLNILNITSSSDGSQSNDSSLSSRQSSTSTGTNTNNSNNSSNSSTELSRQADLRLPSHSGNFRQTQDSETSNSKASSRPRNADLEENLLLLSVESASASVSNAHLKTGLQTTKQQKRDIPTAEVTKPQPKPRYLSSLQREAGVRKMSVPSLPPKLSNQSPRRGSADNIRPLRLTEDASRKYPSLQLKLEQGAIMELNEATEREQQTHNCYQQRLKPDSSSAIKKDEDGFVTSPVAAVKSRVVVATSNATRVKTSKQVPTPNGQAKIQNSTAGLQPPRRTCYQKPLNAPQKSASQSTAAASDALPPTTPEGPLSPEARTAQWILNSVSGPNKELKHEEDMEVGFTPKDYEDRIIRLENEVERLRKCLSEGAAVQKSLEQKETALLEKVRNYERREARIRRRNEEKDQHIQKMLHRMSVLEANHKREKVELQAKIGSKEFVVNEQQNRIRRLEQTLQRLGARSKVSEQEAAYVKPSFLRQGQTDSQEGAITCIDDNETFESRGRRELAADNKAKNACNGLLLATDAPYSSSL